MTVRQRGEFPGSLFTCCLCSGKYWAALGKRGHICGSTVFHEQTARACLGASQFYLVRTVTRSGSIFPLAMALLVPQGCRSRDTVNVRVHVDIIHLLTTTLISQLPGSWDGSVSSQRRRTEHSVRHQKFKVGSSTYAEQDPTERSLCDI